MGRDASGRPDAAPSLVPLATPPGLVRVVQPGAVYIGADGVPMMAVAHPGPPLGAHHPPPPAPPPAPPAPLAALERACVLAASALAREGHRVSYQAVAARVCASRGATTLAQLGVSDPVAQVPVLEKIWRAQRVVDAHIDAYLGARSIACLLELERDLVDLLRSCCFAPLPRVTAETPPPRDPDEIALPGDDDDAHEADGAPRDDEPVLDRTHGSDFASFGLGRIEAIPAVAAACASQKLWHCAASTCVSRRSRYLRAVWAARASGTVPESLSRCVNLTQLALDDNPNLTITAACKAAIMKASPNAKYWWPEVKD